MPVLVTQGFASLDAGQGGGVVDVSAFFELDGALLAAARAGVPFDYIGAPRNTELGGLIGTDVLAGRLVPDTLITAIYTDLITSSVDQTHVTFVFRITSAVKAAANPETTIVGPLQKLPLSGISHGVAVHFPVAIMAQTVTYDDATTVSDM